MNRPPEQFKHIPAEQLRRFAAACLESAGMLTDHAQQLAELLTNGDVRGVRSHGTRALQGYCKSLRNGGINPRPDLQVLKETDTAVLIDGDGGLGYAPMMLATEKAIVKARTKGVAVGASCHIGHYGSAGHYVRRAMQEGCTAFSVQGQHSDYFGEGGGNKGQQAAYWGNPPICFGLPSQDEPPLILDAATCIMADYQRGEPFDALQELIPAAFFKSMGYTGVAKALGGAFVGQNNPRAQAVAEQWPASQNGGLIIVMDLGLFAPPEELRTGVDNLVRGVRETMAPVRGYTEATLPGTIEFRNEEAYGREGIPMGLEDVEQLEEVGRECDVEPEWR
jgi:LDH2 family malate/lactate/ureidoglycolate dehydrogenase